MSGRIVGIFTAAASGASTAAHDEVKAVAGRGIEGDRYFEDNEGEHDPADEITLIEAEGLQRASTEHDVDLDPGEHRRNLVAADVDLLALVGSTIVVGEAEIEVLADNPPCRYLQDLTGKPVVTALRGKGGVRGRIVAGGTIRLGDPIQTG